MPTPFHTSRRREADRTPEALRHLALCVGCFVLLSLVSYGHPWLERFRPWVGGEAPPIVRMFTSRDEAPGFAEAGGTGRHPSDLRESLGAAVASSLEEGDDDVAAEEAPAQEEAAVSPGAHARVWIEPREYDGITQRIEFPQALARFFTKLKYSAERRPGAVTRVAHYGDSAVAADAISRTARRKLQRRFGDAGHGFVIVARGRMYYTHSNVQTRSSGGWEVLSVVRSQLRSGFYGYGGIQARGNTGDSASFATAEQGVGRHVSRFELYYQRFPQAGELEVSVLGLSETRQVVDMSGPRGDGFVSVKVPDGPHELQLRVRRGYARLYGVVLERDVPGVVYDALGLVGARAQRLLNAPAPHWESQIAHRAPDLLVLGFGGNEAGSNWLEMDRYEADLRQVVDTMRAGKPEMDCLLFGPLDQAERNSRGDVVTIDKLPRIVEVQRRVARDMGCAFFDTYAAMGGRGTFYRWYKSRPQLASSDFRHATPEGYKVVGNLYYKALLAAFAASLRDES